MPRMTAPRLAVRAIDFFERATPLRIPFKFGANTLTQAPQVFVRAEVAVDGKSVTGQAAELLAPKWFDKNPALSNEQNFDQLRASLGGARHLYLNHGAAASAFALHAAVYPAHYAEADRAGLNGLIASYGMALVDRAVLDALCRARGADVFDAMRANLPGITTALTPDLAADDLGAFLAARQLPAAIWARHTVGMTDPLTDGDIVSPLNDGLPQSLEAVIAAYGNRYFKVKVGGDIGASVEHLVHIAAILDRVGGDYRVTMDGNEQFSKAAELVELFDRIEATVALRRLWASTLFVEQPIARDRALAEPVQALARRKPLVIDESDSDLELFRGARRLGYAGVSAKTCKGVYRALLNAARAATWNAAGAACFITAEDLTVQPGIALQHSLALAALVGAEHIEVNGHHFVGGFAGAPPAEQARFAAAHPDLYRLEEGRARLRINGGRIARTSLEVPGFAVGCEPDWDCMRPMATSR